MKNKKPLEWLSNDFSEFVEQSRALSEEKRKIFNDELITDDELENGGGATNVRWLREKNLIGYADDNDNARLVLPALFAFVYAPEAKTIQWAHANNFLGCDVVPKEILLELCEYYDVDAFNGVSRDVPTEDFVITLCQCLETWMDAVGYECLEANAGDKSIHLYFILMHSQEQ